MIGIDVWNGSSSQVQIFAQGGGRNLTYPLGMLGGSYGSQWGLDRHSFVIVNANGVIQYISPQSTHYTQRLAQHEAEMIVKLNELTMTTDVQNEQESAVAGFQLYQNSPNPFMGTTVLRFEVGAGAETQSTRLAVFDLLGREMRQIVNRRLAPGAYAMQWDGKDASGRPVPSGIYFYELISGRQRLLKRMIHLSP